MTAMASFPLLAEGDTSVRKVDINMANENELAQIPFIDSQLAEAIVSYREKVGGFVLFEELLQVEGFNRDLFLKVKSYLFLNGMPGEDCGC
jgi:competence ComEA-like helix-hairpin-helix protein